MIQICGLPLREETKTTSPSGVHDGIAPSDVRSTLSVPSYADVKIEPLVMSGLPCSGSAVRNTPFALIDSGVSLVTAAGGAASVGTGGEGALPHDALATNARHDTRRGARIAFTG